MRGSVNVASAACTPSSSSRGSVEYVNYFLIVSVLPAGAVPWMIPWVPGRSSLWSAVPRLSPVALTAARPASV